MGIKIPKKNYNKAIRRQTHKIKSIIRSKQRNFFRNSTHRTFNYTINQKKIFFSLNSHKIGFDIKKILMFTQEINDLLI